ncbi:Uma2 family endonuclease [Catalinimonas sp. 4WD22]|uniref:Uma2 family endonuclease n=1 Tax=Catalinimonas locisalis TaxID=3133978 RepID=UPI003100ABB9
MVNDKPVYYKNYRDYLDGKKQLEEIMGSSYLQSDIISMVFYFLMSSVGKKYKVLTNELGLQLERGTTRSADIAIISKAKLKSADIKDKRKYITIPPEVVIEVDVKADLEENQQEFSYINTKTEQLFKFGVAKVIWILSGSEKIIVAEPGVNWEIVSWNKDICIIDSLMLNLQNLLEEK